MVKTLLPDVPLSEYHITLNMKAGPLRLTLEEVEKILEEKLPSFAEIHALEGVEQMADAIHRMELKVMLHDELRKKDFRKHVHRKGQRQSERLRKKSKK